MTMYTDETITTAERIARDMAHKAEPYPHQGCCGRCLDAKVCTVCGISTRGDSGRCTNGHCSRCHRDCCTDGGDTCPGHGYGTPETRQRVAEQRHAETDRTPADHGQRSSYYAGMDLDDVL